MSTGGFGLFELCIFGVIGLGLVSFAVLGVYLLVRNNKPDGERKAGK